MSQELEGTLTNTANLVGTFGSEGGGGTTNYNDLINKPSINSVTLQGNKTASQLGFAEVATSGNYNDLSNKPTIPAAQVNSDWNASSGVAEILNKPTLAAVATSGAYSDLTGTPTIPAAQVNSDWNASSGVAEILNKPTVYQNAAELPVSSTDTTDTKSYIDTGLAKIGAIINGTISGSVSCANETNTEIGSIVLDKGIYILVACCDWGSNSSGYRQVGVSSNINGARNDISSTMACNGTNKETYVQFIKVLNIETDNTITKVYGAQNSGSTLSAFPYIYAVRLA